VVVKDAGGAKGKGLFAVSSVEEEGIIYEERPLVRSLQPPLTDSHLDAIYVARSGCSTLPTGWAALFAATACATLVRTWPPLPPAVARSRLPPCIVSHFCLMAVGSECVTRSCLQPAHVCMSMPAALACCHPAACHLPTVGVTRVVTGSIEQQVARKIVRAALDASEELQASAEGSSAPGECSTSCSDRQPSISAEERMRLVRVGGCQWN
jgi:hypothetical protein